MEYNMNRICELYSELYSFLKPISWIKESVIDYFKHLVIMLWSLSGQLFSHNVLNPTGRHIKTFVPVFGRKGETYGVRMKQGSNIE